MPFLRKVRLLARMITIEHSVFALPFAYLGVFLAARGWPGWRAFALLTVAMVAVRSFAMAFNRLADLDHDRLNPRTKNRPLAAGEVGLGEARLLTAACGVAFVLACAGLNHTCLLLSPAALAWAGFYSYTKRFTWLCHFALGAVLGLAPLGGWLAVEPVFSLPAVLFFWGVTFWVAGFDILYACQDTQFDRANNLHSIPARFGHETAFTLAAFCHADTALFFLLGGWAAGLSWPFYAVWAVASGVLLWEHRVISPNDLSRLNLAFFTLNGLISIALFAGVLLALFA